MDNLKARRKALGLTQAQLADLLEVERVTVTRWESGKHVPAGNLLERAVRDIEFEIGLTG